MDLGEFLILSIQRIDIRSVPMKTLLKLNSSIFGGNGTSSRLTEAFVARWLVAHPGTLVIERDLATNPVPHLTADAFAGFSAKPGERSPAQQTAAEVSDALIDELKRADGLVLGLPMYNFGVRSRASPPPTALASSFVGASAAYAGSISTPFSCSTSSRPTMRRTTSPASRRILTAASRR